jgi:hypothetical protein
MFIGVMVFEIMKPAKILPMSSHLMEFMNCRLFSLMLMY